MKHRRYDTLPSFVDLLFNVMMGVLLLFMLAFPYVNPNIQKKDGAALKAEYIITAEWEANADVDMWVQDPKGGIVYFRQREMNVMHLDTDNQGSITNTVVLPDGKVLRLENYAEMVTLRGIVPGEYTVNLHLYTAKNEKGNYHDRATALNIPVRVSIQKINPSVTKVFNKVVILNHPWDEITVTRFTLRSDGTLEGFDPSEKKLIP